MTDTKILIDTLQQYKETFKNMKDKEGADILVNDITIMQSIAMMTEELSDRVASVSASIYASLSLMQFTPEIAEKLAGDYIFAVLIAKIKGMGVKP